MAARKAKPKPSKTAISEKATIKKPRKPSARPERIFKASYRVKRYRNGLLNLETTPPHLVSLVQSNAQSPLLRLPAGIRNRIWSFACGGQLIKMPQRDKNNQVGKGGAIRYKNDEGLILTAKHWRSLVLQRGNPIGIVSAFHLPEVCRQIYSETVLIPFKENTFLFETQYLGRQHSLAMLKVAKRRAVTMIEPTPSMLCDLAHPSNVVYWKERYGIWSVLPNVRILSITRLAMRCVQLQYHAYHTIYGRPSRAHWAEGEWRESLSVSLKDFDRRGHRVGVPELSSACQLSLMSQSGWPLLNYLVGTAAEKLCTDCVDKIVARWDSGHKDGAQIG